MKRRTALKAAIGAPLFAHPEFGLPWVLPLLRVILGLEVRGAATASVAGRALASRAVTRTVVRGGVTKTIQTVTTAEMGISIAGVTALSLTAAELLKEYDCKALCVQGVSDTGKVISEAFSKPSHVTVNIYNTVTGKFEDYARQYVNPGRFEYSFDLPRSLPLGVKFVEGVADDDKSVKPFRSANILLAGAGDVFS